MKAVERIKGKYPLSQILEVIGMSRSTWYYNRNYKVEDQDKYGELQEKMEEIIIENPGYGSRRIKLILEERYGITVSRKVILRLLGKWSLNMHRNARKNKKSGYRKGIEQAGESADLIKGKEEIQIFEAACTDFTELEYAGGEKKGSFIAVVGMNCKMIWGWAIGRKQDTPLALRAWERSIETFKENQISYLGMIVHQDQDSVFTADRWVERLMREDKVRLSYSTSGARGNQMMESFNGHFKGEALSLFCESQTLEELREALKKQVNYWNTTRRHSSLGYSTPQSYMEDKRC